MKRNLFFKFFVFYVFLFLLWEEKKKRGKQFLCSSLWGSTSRPQALDIWAPLSGEGANSLVRGMEAVQQTTQVGVEGLCPWERLSLNWKWDGELLERRNTKGPGHSTLGACVNSWGLSTRFMNLGVQVRLRGPTLRQKEWKPSWEISCCLWGSQVWADLDTKPGQGDLLQMGKDWMASRRGFLSSQDSLRLRSAGLLYNCYDTQALTLGDPTLHHRKRNEISLAKKFFLAFILLLLRLFSYAYFI